MELPVLSSESKTTIREVQLHGLKYKQVLHESDVEISLHLERPTTSGTVEVILYIYMEAPGHPDQCLDARIETDDCLSLEALPSVAIDSRSVYHLLWLAPTDYKEAPAFAIEQIFSRIAAPAAKLNIIRDQDHVRFELAIGPIFRTEATVPLSELAAFLEPV